MRSNFLHNIKTCMCIRKNYKNGGFSPSHFCDILQDTMYWIALFAVMGVLLVVLLIALNLTVSVGTYSTVHGLGPDF